MLKFEEYICDYKKSYNCIFDYIIIFLDKDFGGIYEKFYTLHAY
jgi:hypothetical protein